MVSSIIQILYIPISSANFGIIILTFCHLVNTLLLPFFFYDTSFCSHLCLFYFII